MSEKIVWQCDGCDAEKVMDGRTTGDWHKVSMHTEGFAGYPTCATEPTSPAVYHLCPSCTTLLYEQTNPRRWERAIPPSVRTKGT